MSFQAIGLALVTWATARVGVHLLSLRLPYLGVFPFTLFHPAAIRFRSCFFFTHPFGRPFISYSLLGEFPGLGLALVPEYVVP